MTKLKWDKTLRDNFAGWAFVLPCFIFLFLFMIYPIINTFILSFQQYNFVYDESPTFIGLQNYLDVFKNTNFQRASINTGYFALVYIPVALIIGFFAGMLLAQEDLFSAGVSRVVLFIPMVIPLSMSCFMFLFILNPQWGLINSLFKDYLNLPALARDWMNNTSTALNIILVVTIWQRIGFIALLFMAGIQAIPRSVMEAAIIDGAGVYTRIVKIILPNLKETFLIVTMLTIVTAIKLFAQVVAMTGANSPTNAGGPAGSTLTLYVVTWREAFINYEMGLGSAMGYVMALIITILFAVNFWINKTERS